MNLIHEGYRQAFRAGFNLMKDQAKREPCPNCGYECTYMGGDGDCDNCNYCKSDVPDEYER